MGGKVPVSHEQTEDGFSRLLTELRQWHVFRFAAAYGVVAWLLVQVVATVGPAFDMPGWVLRAVVLVAIVGFLVTMASLLFRPRSAGKGRVPIYLSPRTRLIAGVGVLLIAAVAAALSIRSLSAHERIALAVLPFADLSPQHDKAYFAEGVGEEILSTLAAEKGIKVLGRSSARQLDSNADPKVIRASLGVTHLLEGSTRTAGNSLRVNVRLIDTSDGSEVWEEEYNGTLTDVFSVQDQIATTVARRLRGTFFGHAEAAEQTAVGAYDTYLAARALMRTRSEAKLTEALNLAKKVIASDPNYAPGHAIYAELIYLLSDDSYAYGHIPLDRARELALPEAHKAIELAPDKAEGYAALGLVVSRDEAVEPLRRAIALDPGRTELRVWLGVALTALGRHDEAYKEITASAEAEPLWPVAINRLVQVLASSGRIAEALDAARNYRARGGSEGQYHRFLATIARGQADLSAAAMHDALAFRLDKDMPAYVPENLANELALLGLRDRASAAWPHRGDYGSLLIAGRFDELAQKAMIDGPKVWSDRSPDLALFALGRARDWSALAQLYRERTPRFSDYCNEDPHSVPLLILALRATGDMDEAERLRRCATSRLDREAGMKWASPNAEPGRLEFRRSALLGAAGDKRALDWLDKAVQRGWLGQYYSADLADWPQFDAFRTDPRYAAIQKRIDAVIARERAEALAGH